MAPTLDASTPARVTGTASPITTAAFSPPACLLLAFVSADGGGLAAPTFAISNNGAALTWSNPLTRTSVDNANVGGGVTLFHTTLTAARTGMTVTASLGATNDVTLKVYVLTSASSSPIGGSAAGSVIDVDVFNTNAVTVADTESLGFFSTIETVTAVASGAPTSSNSTFDGFTVSGQMNGGTGYRAFGGVGAAETFAVDGFGTGTTRDWHWIALEVKAAPVLPVVGAGNDTFGLVNSGLARTATESDSGITARSWTVFSGPAQVGATLSTAAALTWTPGTLGVYVLRYSATNSIGTGTDDVSVTVVEGPANSNAMAIMTRGM